MRCRISNFSILLWLGILFSTIIIFYTFFNRKQEVKCLVEAPPPSTSNFPFGLYDQCNLNSPKLFIGKKCTKFPTLDQIEFNNLLWQKATVDGSELYLLGAYYDTRTSSEASIRILAASENVTISKVTCQIWFRNHGNVVESSSIEDLSSPQDSHRSLLITCEVPEIFDDKIPLAVSIASYECAKSTNVLRIRTEFDGMIKKDLAICSTELVLDVTPRDLIVWMEFVKSFGASKIYLYSAFQKQSIKGVIKQYEKEGILRVVPIMLPDGLPNMEVLQEEIIRDGFQWSALPLHECFYNHMDKYQRISFLKIEEIDLDSTKGDWSVFQYEIIRNLSRKSNGFENNRISSYNTDKVIVLGGENSPPKCLLEDRCKTQDLFIELKNLRRRSLTSVLSGVEKVLYKISKS